MPWLPLYADSTDVAEVLAYLNTDDECAFIVSDGRKRWRAAPSLSGLPDGRHCLWIHSGGSLPLLRTGNQPDEVIPDPWTGWVEQVTGADPSQPYFGAGHPTVVWFNVHTRGRDAADAIGISSFEWIGNRYRCIGSGAPEAVEKWWKRLGRNIKKSARRVPRFGAIDGVGAEIWACTSALRKMTDGVPRDGNPSV